MMETEQPRAYACLEGLIVGVLIYSAIKSFIMGLLPLLVSGWRTVTGIEKVLSCTPVWLSLSYRRRDPNSSLSPGFFSAFPPSFPCFPLPFLPSSLIEFFFLLQTSD